MNYADFLDLTNPQSFFNAFSFACCFISMVIGAQAKGLFLKGSLAQAALLLIGLFVIIGFLSHYSFAFLNQLMEVY